jgi:hypothetical protein
MLRDWLLTKILPEDPGSCRSSVVEHSLGKGEVVCSIHTGSTTETPIKHGFHPWVSQDRTGSLDLGTAFRASGRVTQPESKRSLHTREAAGSIPASSTIPTSLRASAHPAPRLFVRVQRPKQGISE